jgi:hypothetical protein
VLKKELTMKFKANALFFGMYLAVGIFAANIPAEARSTTGWNSFRGHGIDCVSESYGAAVNLCSAAMNMAFETVVDTAGWKTIAVWDSPNGYGSFTCEAVSFSGVSDGVYVGTPLRFNPSGQESLNFSTYVYPGWAMSLYCYSVPQGRGIAIMNWKP